MYVINVSTKKKSQWDFPRHVMRTAEDSITTFEAAVAVAKQLRKAFPAKTHEIEITRWERTGSTQEWEG